MAKRKKSRSGGKTRTVTKTVKSYVGRAKQKAGGAIAGFIAGAGGTLVGKYMPTLGQWTQPAADLATGVVMGNDTLVTIGGRSVGAMLATGLPSMNGTHATNGNSLVG